MLAGDSLTQELYSPHLDVHQRMLILESMATAAQQLSDPRLRLRAGHTSQISLLQPGPSSRSLVGQHTQDSHKVMLMLHELWPGTGKIHQTNQSCHCYIMQSVLHVIVLESVLRMSYFWTMHS